MFTRLLTSHRIATIVFTLSSGLILFGCQGSDEEPVSPESAQETPAEEPARTEESSQAAVAGQVTFQLDGEMRDFGFLPFDDNFYRRLASTITAKPEADATEAFRITILSIDLREAEIPGELPPADAGTTIANAQQMVGFDYTDPAGERWVTTGPIHVESFDDGTLTATFSDLTLHHTEREQPEITVTDGSVRAKID